MTIRLLTASKTNLSEIFEINRAVQANPWSLGSIESELEFSGGYQTIAVDDHHRVRAYLFARLTEDGAELLVIGVAEDAKRQGLGKRLINELVEELRRQNKSELFLEVSHKNGMAIEFYKSLGFQLYHVRKVYYSDGTDALCMKLKLANPQ